ncbi:MAG TPA: hypothetical protein DEQ47_16145 [Solibacterales bacterium]|jgi:type IV pilus assembly protein PilN|nr:hypothetical protein [Bryobacterales bacterium]
MSNVINLASEPFRRDRAALVASSALVALLSLSLIVLASLWITDRNTTADERALLAQLQRRLDAATKEQNRINVTLRQPDNAQVLDRSILLNTLIYRKAISWTRLFADLERVTPANVRIISVRPQVDAQNHIFLDMTVGSDSQENVVNMLIKLESSEFFGATEVSGVLPPSQTDPLYRYRLSVNYVQKL